VKYGIPQGQALAAWDVTAQRRRIAQRVRMWEKRPGYRGRPKARSRSK
jgi:hypothetical protein